MQVNPYLSREEKDRLQSVKIGIGGAGGLGSNAAMHLVRAGIEHLVLAVDTPRQIGIIVHRWPCGVCKGDNEDENAKVPDLRQQAQETESFPWNPDFIIVISLISTLCSSHINLPTLSRQPYWMSYDGFHLRWICFAWI